MFCPTNMLAVRNSYKMYYPSKHQKGVPFNLKQTATNLKKPQSYSAIVPYQNVYFYSLNRYNKCIKK